ncbi:probable serine/threonine-protein kinase SIS8 [Impatiens glandulifera]|uniref:probable serine/threonine-protein kinase SIS8 n=1 Tax=Impatiens glandulifera TaxID=253017 RepID=UPI001FB08C18|nr:probable serine/threonine-protein kinase SIS8 [Impatiens glandulifera]
MEKISGGIEQEKTTICGEDDEYSISQKASQTLWATGKLSGPIPDGFYSVLPEGRLRQLDTSIPSLDGIFSLDSEDIIADIILVDAEKDKKLSMLKQLAVTLVKGLDSNPSILTKKIAGLVSDIYKQSNLYSSPARAGLEDFSCASTNQVQMLGQIRQGTCHARAILFKVLADSVGLPSSLVVGLPSDGIMERSDSHKHMSVTVILNSVEQLVDLVRSPGQLLPNSTKAILMSHISAAGEGDCADNDSCDSPLEPNSPLCSFTDQVGVERVENSDAFLSPHHCKLEASGYVPGPSLRNIMLRQRMKEGKLNSSKSEPNVGNALWWNNRKKVAAEQHTVSLSPEHPLLRARGRSNLGCQRDYFRGFTKDVSISRSAGASPETRRRRRSISEIPKIGDDIVRAVRAMNEALKLNRLAKEHVDSGGSLSTSKEDSELDSHEHASNFNSDEHNEKSATMSPQYFLERKHIGSQKAFSLPTSPHKFSSQSSTTSEAVELGGNNDMVNIWNKVLESSKTLNKPLLPFEEWNIDFSELTVGARVGIGFFGEVFRGLWNGIDVAIKVFLEQETTTENIEDFCNEISILSRLRHPNVILFLGACTKPPHLSMITEYSEMGSLYHLIHASLERKRISWRRRLKMLSDICRGLMCIHRMKIAHRDLKTANCLVNKHWSVKICDFGLSRFLSTRPMKDSSSAGTPEWMAPELIRNEPFTEKCDIFSLGVIIWELYTLNRPWEGVPSLQVVEAVGREGQRLEIPQGPVGMLISDCWAEPDERPSCEEVLSRLIQCEHTVTC